MNVFNIFKLLNRNASEQDPDQHHQTKTGKTNVEQGENGELKGSTAKQKRSSLNPQIREQQEKEFNTPGSFDKPLDLKGPTVPQNESVPVRNTSKQINWKLSKPMTTGDVSHEAVISNQDSVQASQQPSKRMVNENYGDEDKTDCRPQLEQNAGRYEGNKTPGHQLCSPLNIVLLGKQGVGKSATGNTILGRKAFHSRASSLPVTTRCQVGQIEGTQVRVIDTPDFFDENIKDKYLHKPRELYQTGPCVYLLVMQIGRFTDGERNILENLERAFESKIRDDTIVLFTRGENLTFDGVTIDEYIRDANKHLENTLQLCGGRFIVFENKNKNKDKDKEQVAELFKLVDEMRGSELSVNMDCS